jgi:hypothetical protein
MRENSIKVDLREMGWCVMDRIVLATDKNQWKALVNTLWGPWVP